MSQKPPLSTDIPGQLDFAGRQERSELPSHFQQNVKLWSRQPVMTWAPRQHSGVVCPCAEVKVNNS